MRIEDEALLTEFRQKSWCEWCGRPCNGTDPHHIWARGMGGGGRLDVRVNLVALCRQCHGDVHAGAIERFALLAIVAARERTTQDAIEREVYRLRRLDKHASPRDGQSVPDNRRTTEEREAREAPVRGPGAGEPARGKPADPFEAEQRF